jgi:hypothetical protein
MSFIVGCGILNDPKGSGERQTEKAVKQQSEIDEIPDSAVRLNVVLNKDIVNSQKDLSLTIEDQKIIRDIISMVKASTPLADESLTNKMSGALTKNNILIFGLNNGNDKEMSFRFDDLYEFGYIEVGNKKIVPKYDFFRYLQDLREYRNYSTIVDADVVKLFKKYDWTVDYKINSLSERLPSNLKHSGGEFPVKLYWAYNNELSREVGLDFTNYLGDEVKVEIYRLREPLPEFMKPRRNARGIVLKSNQKIIGAFIDAGRHDSFACSLNRKSLKEITGKDWERWIDNYIDYDNKTEKKLSLMEPEDIIREHFKALNEHDQDLLYGTLTKRSLSMYLSVNMDNNEVYRRSYREVFSDGYDNNVKKVKLLKVRKIEVPSNHAGMTEYEVTADYDFAVFTTSEDGVQIRFVTLQKETPRRGWRIDSIGTGP